MCVPYPYSFTAKEFRYVNLGTPLPEEPVYLPMVIYPNSHVEPIQFNLKSIKLDQLSKLTLQLDDVTDTGVFTTITNKYGLISNVFVVIIIVLIICIIYYRKRLINKLRIKKLFKTKLNANENNKVQCSNLIDAESLF